MAGRKNTPKPSGGWNPVADWYAGWVGRNGSIHHRRLAIPAVMELLQPRTGEDVLDVGCGPGVLAPHIARARARYTGIDASRKLIAFSQRHHGAHGRFMIGDVTSPGVQRQLGEQAFDAAVFMLSIQDIDPLEQAVAHVAQALRRQGRVVMLMTHPCFRVPRQSGWGWDIQRRLQYRRVDRYLSELAVPMKRFGTNGRGATRSFHRPLQQYVRVLARCGFTIDALREIPSDLPMIGDRSSRAAQLANEEIPLFLCLRARRQS